MSDQGNAQPVAPAPRPTHPRRPGLRKAGFGAAVLLACGVGAGVTALADRGRTQMFVPLNPSPISTMKEWTPVAIKGQVADIFGGKFIVTDDSGKALVETGPSGDRGSLVAASETITVQGRFEHGSIHAIAIQHADGRTVMVAPPPPPGPPLPPGRGPLS